MAKLLEQAIHVVFVGAFLLAVVVMFVRSARYRRNLASLGFRPNGSPWTGVVEGKSFEIEALKSGGRYNSLIAYIVRLPAPHPRPVMEATRNRFMSLVSVSRRYDNRVESGDSAFDEEVCVCSPHREETRDFLQRASARTAIDTLLSLGIQQLTVDRSGMEIRLQPIFLAMPDGANRLRAVLRTAFPLLAEMTQA